MAPAINWLALEDDDDLLSLSYPEWESQTQTLDVLRTSYTAALERIHRSDSKVDACVLELRALLAAAVVRGDLDEVNLLTVMISEIVDSREDVAHQRRR